MIVELLGGNIIICIEAKSNEKGTSNEQLMLDTGWLPVYDCGQAVYSYHI